MGIVEVTTHHPQCCLNNSWSPTGGLHKAWSKHRGASRYYNIFATACARARARARWATSSYSYTCSSTFVTSMLQVLRPKAVHMWLQRKFAILIINIPLFSGEIVVHLTLSCARCLLWYPISQSLSSKKRVTKWKAENSSEAKVYLIFEEAAVARARAFVYRSSAVARARVCLQIFSWRARARARTLLIVTIIWMETFGHFLNLDIMCASEKPSNFKLVEQIKRGGLGNPQNAMNRIDKVKCSSIQSLPWKVILLFQLTKLVERLSLKNSTFWLVGSVYLGDFRRKSA